MAMDGNKLGDEIAAAITDSGASAEAKNAVKAVWEKIGTCIVKHITTNAAVAGGGESPVPGKVS
jgi:hypothetical protein